MVYRTMGNSEQAAQVRFYSVWHYIIITLGAAAETYSKLILCDFRFRFFATTSAAAIHPQPAVVLGRNEP